MFRVRPDQLEAFRDTARRQAPATAIAALGAEGLEVDYDDERREVLARDDRGAQTRLGFDAAGLPTRLVTPEGVEDRFEHDAEGRLSAVERVGGPRVELGRREDGCVTALSLGEARYGFERDGEGRFLAFTEPNGATTHLRYDDAGRVCAKTDPTGATTRYEHDDRGDLVRIVEPSGEEVRFERRDGALTALVYPGRHREEHRPDPDRAETTVVTPSGSRIRHHRTADERHEELRYDDGSFVRYEYDGAQLVLAENREATLSRSYDGSGNLLREAGAGGAVQCAYEGERLAEVVTPAGDRIVYGYDADGRLTTVTDWEGRTTTLRYAPSGAVCEVAYPNGIVETRSTASCGRMQQSRVSRGGHALSEQRYEYDLGGRLVAIEDRRGGKPRRVRRLEHDAAGRLRAVRNAATGALETELRYDEAGDLVRDDLGERTVAQRMTVSHAGRAIVRDVRGRVRELPTSEGTLRCTFDEADQLVEVDTGRERYRYRYDALGRRIEKTDGRRTWRYGWLEHQLLWETYEEAPGAQPVRRDYLVAPGALLPLGFREGGRSYYLQADSRGAVIRVFDEHGDVAWSADYDAFGRARIEIARVRQTFRLLGQQHDPETGLHYHLTRYFCPRLKAYLSPDPFWPLPGTTRETYCDNAPYDRVDPFGRFAFLLAPAAVAVGGAVVGAVASAVTGGDPIQGAIEGGATAIGGVLGALGGPAGAAAGAMVGNVAGTFAGSMASQWRNGDPICVECAAQEAAVAGAMDLALLGAAKIPGVKQVARRMGEEVGGVLKKKALDPLRQWAGGRISTVVKRPVAFYRAKIKKPVVDAADLPRKIKPPTRAERRLAAAPGKTPDQIAARKKVAIDFYQRRGKKRDYRHGNITRRLKPSEVAGELNGIDFTKPVSAGPPPPIPPSMGQWQVASGKRGAYFAEHEYEPSDLGIADVGKDYAAGKKIVPKTQSTHSLDPKVDYLRSTSSPIMDTWSSNAPVFSPGGGTQYYVPGGYEAGNPLIQP